MFLGIGLFIGFIIGVLSMLLVQYVNRIQTENFYLRNENDFLSSGIYINSKRQ